MLRAMRGGGIGAEAAAAITARRRQKEKLAEMSLSALYLRFFRAPRHHCGGGVTGAGVWRFAACGVAGGV